MAKRNFCMTRDHNDGRGTGHWSRQTDGARTAVRNVSEGVARGVDRVMPIRRSRAPLAAPPMFSEQRQNAPSPTRRLVIAFGRYAQPTSSGFTHATPLLGRAVFGPVQGASA
jgi:hypothetical protein